MKISVNTNWLLLLLLIFTGQTLAVPLTNFNDCEMEHSTSLSSDASMSDHEMDSMPDHDMSAIEISSDDNRLGMTMDCCIDDCQCSDGLFAPSVYFSILENKVAFFIDRSLISQDSQFINTQRPSSIYRPPIFS